MYLHQSRMNYFMVLIHCNMGPSSKVYYITLINVLTPIKNELFYLRQAMHIHKLVKSFFWMEMNSVNVYIIKIKISRFNFQILPCNTMYVSAYGYDYLNSKIAIALIHTHNSLKNHYNNQCLENNIWNHMYTFCIIYCIYIFHTPPAS